MRRPLLLVLVAGVVFLGGCGGSDAPSVPGVPIESPEPSERAAPPAVGSAAPERAEVTRTGAGDAKVAVLRFRQPFQTGAAGLPARRGHEYAAVEIKVCVTRNDGNQGMKLTWAPWSLATLDGVVTRAVSAWSDDWWDEPLYPDGQVIRTNRCARGWVPFEVRKGSKPELISYAPSEAYVLEWAIATDRRRRPIAVLGGLPPASP